jgi:hypothetical protein
VVSFFVHLRQNYTTFRSIIILLYETSSRFNICTNFLWMSYSNYWLSFHLLLLVLNFFLISSSVLLWMSRITYWLLFSKSEYLFLIFILKLKHKKRLLVTSCHCLLFLFFPIHFIGYKVLWFTNNKTTAIVRTNISPSKAQFKNVYESFFFLNYCAGWDIHCDIYKSSYNVSDIS